MYAHWPPACALEGAGALTQAVFEWRSLPARFFLPLEVSQDLVGQGLLIMEAGHCQMAEPVNRLQHVGAGPGMDWGEEHALLDGPALGREHPRKCRGRFDRLFDCEGLLLLERRDVERRRDMTAAARCDKWDMDLLFRKRSLRGVGTAVFVLWCFVLPVAAPAATHLDKLSHDGGGGMVLVSAGGKGLVVSACAVLGAVMWKGKAFCHTLSLTCSPCTPLRTNLLKFWTVL